MFPHDQGRDFIARKAPLKCTFRRTKHVRFLLSVSIHIARIAQKLHDPIVITHSIDCKQHNKRTIMQRF